MSWNAATSACRFGSGRLALPGVSPIKSGAVCQGLSVAHAARSVSAQLPRVSISGDALALAWPGMSDQV
jgi:hypothetical protein